MLKPTTSYTIVPRSEGLGAGWKLSVFQDGSEIAGGVFDSGDDGYQDAIDTAQSTIASLGGGHETDS